MRMIGATAVLAAALLCCSCTSNIDFAGEMQVLRDVKSCCTTLQGQPFATLTVGSSRTFEIERTNPAFDFGAHGLSYFAGFVLPDAEPGMELRVRSEGIGAGLNAQPCCIFFPVVTLYDSEMRPIAESQLNQIRYHNDLSSLGYATIVIVLTPQARYAVVHTSRPLIDRGVRPWSNFVQGHAAPGIVWDTMDRAEFDMAPVSGKGNMTITIEPHSDSMWKGANYAFQGF